MLIEKFEIRNLFGMYNVSLDLNKLVTIYVGENGLGKTTILNCLYYVLKCNFEKLKDINFESIEIKFEENKSFKINYTDILEYTRDDSHYGSYGERYYRYIVDIFNEDDINTMIDIVKNEQFNREDLRKYIIKLSEIAGMPSRIAERTLYRFCLEKINNKVKGNAQNVINLMRFIKENNISDNIIYFTTYRRIEKNIFESNKSIREYDEENIRIRKSNDLIHFGMDDVETLINRTLEKIRFMAINGYNEMTGVLLKQYLRADIKDSEKYKIDSQKLNIALDRIGNKIDDNIKNKIKDEIEKNNEQKNTNKYLLNLLENLINNYEKQNEYDDKIRNFVNTCNKYLNGKRFEYNESNVEVNIINLDSKTSININNLSSGEKQIISIFAKLYLDTEKESIILIDEPELSLSIEWQSMLIPDMVKTDKCNKVVAVTHSPFIFENEYEKYAKSMKNVFKYKE